MKKTGLLVVAALAAGGLFLLTRKSSAAVLGGDSSSTVQRGEVSGKLYAVGIGTQGPGGTLHSVHSPNDQSLLFTFVVLPDSSRSLTAQNPEANPEELAIALEDFGF